MVEDVRKPANVDLGSKRGAHVVGIADSNFRGDDNTLLCAKMENNVVDSSKRKKRPENGAHELLQGEKQCFLLKLGTHDFNIMPCEQDIPGIVEPLDCSPFFHLQVFSRDRIVGSSPTRSFLINKLSGRLYDGERSAISHALS